jgi:membrane-bound lytic murein transglycosylase A
MLNRSWILAVMLVLSACGGGSKDRFEARQLNYDELSDWRQEDHVAALEAFKKSCAVLARKSRPATPASAINIDPLLWGSLCSEAQQVSGNEQAREFFERRFVPYRIANNGREQGLFTGYYEPVLYGSLRKTGDFRYPLYAPPPELKTSKPYYSRTEIERGALAKRGLEIMWVDDPVMLFFMQIQGSGRVRLQDGREVRIGYADQNGQPYVSLGKIMGDEGYLPKDGINFFTIRQWLYEHPAQAIPLMQRNPSYVFFKVMDKPEVVGAIGAPLTVRRSIAVDNKYIPYGLPLYMETQLPSNSGVATAFHRLMVAQDTGGAIKSPVRADIFFGAGEEAEYMAGYMKNYGVYSLLVPKEITSQMP